MSPWKLCTARRAPCGTVIVVSVCMTVLVASTSENSDVSIGFPCLGRRSRTRVFLDVRRNRIGSLLEHTDLALHLFRQMSAEVGVRRIGDQGLAGLRDR